MGNERASGVADTCCCSQQVILNTQFRHGRIFVTAWMGLGLLMALALKTCAWGWLLLLWRRAKAKRGCLQPRVILNLVTLGSILLFSNNYLHRKVIFCHFTSNR